MPNKFKVRFNLPSSFSFSATSFGGFLGGKLGGDLLVLIAANFQFLYLTIDLKKLGRLAGETTSCMRFDQMLHTLIVFERILSLETEGWSSNSHENW